MHIRGVTEKFISNDVCEELSFIHRSTAVVGYRPNVLSTTLFDLILGEPRLLPAVVRVRQLVWDYVEEFFDKACQVFVEHTSLISWHPGASIDWHHDANRDYLSQRHFSAVLYLNTQGEDFTGGTFSFQSGPPPLLISPAAGTLLVYTADEGNVHRVEEVTAGQRLTLTMWFTLVNDFQEDAKVLAQLSASGLQPPGLPETMYLQGPDNRDIRLLQLQRLGWQVVEEGAGSEGQQGQQSQVHQQVEQHPLQKVLVLIPRCTGLHGRHPMAFHSLQEAILTMNMLRWKLCPYIQATAAARNKMSGGLSMVTLQCPVHSSNMSEQQEASAVQDAGGTLLLHFSQHSERQCTSQSCNCSGNQQKVFQARQLLQEYLQESQAGLQQALPMWMELGTLVPAVACT